MSKRMQLLVGLVSATVMAIFVANLAAVKLWRLPVLGIAVDGGLLVFPITYVVGDLTVEFFGRKVADQLIGWSFLCNVIAMAVLVLVGKLPAYPGWYQQEAYLAILGTAAPRITAASLIAYVVAGLVNNLAFVEIQIRQRSRGQIGFLRRAIISSIIGRVFDNLIFETIAFLGILTFPEFVGQMVGAFFEGLIVEMIMTVTISSWLVEYFHAKLD